jgi:hypothetical protein
MEFIVWVETRLAGKTLELQQVASLERPSSGIQPEEIGLTLQDGKTALKQVQERIVQTQINVESAVWRSCMHCQRPQRMKDLRSRRLGTVFGNVDIFCRRYIRCTCRGGKPSIQWPLGRMGLKRNPRIGGSYDQRKAEIRDDVLVYTSAILSKGIEVTGPIDAVLSVASDAKDTDFTAKLVDVYPDGRAFNIQEGILRARYREGQTKKVWFKPGQTVTVRIDMSATANYFGPGHRIRLEVSSSSFPRYDRILNTGGNNYDETRWVSSHNYVIHSNEHSSYVILPVVTAP